MGLYILIPLSVLLVFVIGIIFWWSVRSGQYDDLEGPSVRLLMDDEDEAPRAAKPEVPGQTASGPEQAAMDRRDR
ncbi:MAG: cbb3-type cytochrome oxidase assembly protein CcoS [Rhodocyclales bacterium]|nr:cbb3-type cytochrome oxidase assembly protein CcoS [Rhodocyclales bacterium]